MLNGQTVSPKNMFENNGHIHAYSPGAGADNSLLLFFSLTVLFSQSSPLAFVAIFPPFKDLK